MWRIREVLIGIRIPFLLLIAILYDSVWAEIFVLN